MGAPAVDWEAMLVEDIASFYADALGFVIYAFPWDSEPSLQVVKLPSPWRERYNTEYGPDAWACEMLDEISEQVRAHDFDGRTPVPALQYAVCSGHGIGKSAMAAWLTLWIMSTRPYSRGTVTANTMAQLSTKTWAGVSSWLNKAVNKHWFKITTAKNGMRLSHVQHPDDWFVQAQTSDEQNSESFAGQHAASSTSWYLFDEASGIPPKIWEVSEGGKSDGEPMHFVFGNPTRNTGAFAECFGKMRHRWKTRQIDSRTVQITNKQRIQEQIDDYGADSDFVRVRVRGVFPRASSTQMIPRDLVDDAVARPLVDYRSFTKVAMVGVDVARFGDDESVIFTRLQRDGRTWNQDWKSQCFRELDNMQLAARVGQHINKLQALGLRVLVFVDGGGVGGGVIDRLRQLRHEVIEVNFGGKADDPRKYHNKGAEMWDRCKAWLPTGYLPSGYEQLVTDLTSREYGFNDANQIQIEKKEHMKERGLASPDHADALCLTFAYPAMELVTPPADEPGRRLLGNNRGDYNPLADERLN